MFNTDDRVVITASPWDAVLPGMQGTVAGYEPSDYDVLMAKLTNSTVGSLPFRPEELKQSD